MDTDEALTVFDALSQETRLNAFRMLVEKGPEGLAAGALSSGLGIPHNTLSFHLNHLSNAKVISSRKKGRSIIYSANFDVVHELIGFMVRDCCSADMANIQEDSAAGCSVIEINSCCDSKESHKENLVEAR